jgi:hypothetical protein
MGLGSGVHFEGLHIVKDSKGLHGGVHFEQGWVIEYIVWGLHIGAYFEQST